MGSDGDTGDYSFEDFDTSLLLEALNTLDEVRGSLADGDDLTPPEIRTDLMKLHDIALDVFAYGGSGRSGEMFELAAELDLEIGIMVDDLKSIQEKLSELLELQRGD